MADEPPSSRDAPDDPERTVLAPTTPGGAPHRSQILTQPHVDIELPATQREPAESAPSDVPPSGPVSIPASGTPVTTVPKDAPRVGGPSSNVLPVGTRLAEFEVISVIGEGGFGIVYRAVDHSLRRIVALKEYMPAALASRLPDYSVSVKSAQHAETFRAGLRSFINEARLLARFDHQALVKVYRFWEANGTAYMVMPMYEGGTLKQVLKQRGRPADEAWLRQLLGPLLEAVELLHKAECLHRDIAPDNVILVGGDASPLRPVLLDFGAARRVITEQTQALTVILKPGFAPIEQYDEIPGMKQGPWTDLYALAAVLHYAMVGKPPPPSVGRMLNDSQVPLVQTMRGRYSESFLQAIDRALEPRPDARPRNVAEFRAMLSAGPPAAHATPAAPATPAVSPGASAGAPVLQELLASEEGDDPAATVPAPMPAPASPAARAKPVLPATGAATGHGAPAAAAAPAAGTAAAEPGTSVESLAARWKQHAAKPPGREAAADGPAGRQPGAARDAAPKPFAPTPPTSAADDTLRAMLEATRKEPRGAAPQPTSVRAADPPAGAAGKKLPPWVTPEPTAQPEPAAAPKRSGAKWFVVGMGVLALGAAAFVFVVPRFGQQAPVDTVTPGATSGATPVQPATTTPAAGAGTATTSPASPPLSSPAVPAGAAPDAGAVASSPQSRPQGPGSPEKVPPPRKKPVPVDPVKAAPVARTPPTAGGDGGSAAAGVQPRPEWMQRALREARECLVARDFTCTIQRAETVLASDPDHPAAQRLLKLAKQGQEAALSGDWKMR